MSDTELGRLPAVRLIGQTPTLPFVDELVPPGKRVLLKYEASNPTLSIKDRTALGMISRAMQKGKLRQGETIVETTSGNFGRSLAMLGAAIGFRVVIVVDIKVSSFLLNWYKAFGADVVVIETPDKHGSLQAAREATVKRLLAENPGWVNLDQYNNQDNQDYHREVTAGEFAGLEVEGLCAAVGTGGHLSGIAKTLKTLRPGTVVVAADIVGSGIFGGVYRPYLASGVGLVGKVDNLCIDAIDYRCQVTDDEAFSVCRLLARDHGLLVGGSSGVALFAALNVLNNDPIRSLVVVLPDSGLAYLDQIYSDSFLESHGVRILPRPELSELVLKKRFVNV